MAVKYKVGDKVRIKSRDWYNEHKDMNGNVCFGWKDIFNPCTARHCGQVLTIKYINSLGWYEVEEEAVFVRDEMIEGLVEETKPIDSTVKATNTKGTVEVVKPKGYQFVDENGNVINATKIVLEKKKEYPKTYEECCKVMDCAVHPYITADEPGITSYYEDDLNRKVLSLRKLIICRDAYWKIAGAEMELGKAWEPDCSKGYFIPAIIYRSGSIQKVEVQYRNAILAFPTPEMRDAFYENFKSEIEFCKELL